MCQKTKSNENNSRQPNRIAALASSIADGDVLIELAVWKKGSDMNEHRKASINW